MRRYADPSRCPDCGGILSPGSTTCPSCRLELGGTLGSELYATLLRADGLLDEMRRLSRPMAMAMATPTPGLPVTPPRRGVSVPQVLLALGAVCLLVAALVFLAVTWSVMGVGGRTATLVGFTVTAGALTAWVARRGLRGAAEALGTVTIGLAVLDLYGADSSGWFGDISEAAMTTLVGAALVAGGLLAVRALGRTPAAGFTCGELAVLAGAALASVGIATQGWGSAPARQLLAVLLVMALTASVQGLVRPGSNLFRVAAASLLVLLVLDWAALVFMGLDDLGLEPTMTSAWTDLEAWPLLAAAGVALLVAVPARLPMPVRGGGAAAGLIPLGLAVLAPAGDESTTVLVTAVAAVSLALAALMTFARRPWGATGLAAAALSALALLPQVLVLAATAFDRYTLAAAEEWSGTPGGRLPATDLMDGAAPWLLPLSVAAVLALLWSAARLLEQARAVRPRLVLVSGLLALAVSLLLMLLLLPVPVWTVLLALVTASLAAGVPALVRDHVPAVLVAGTGLAAAVVLSWYDEQLTAVTVGVALVLVTVTHLRTRHEGVATGAGVACALLLAGFVWSTGAVVEAGGSWTGLAGLVVLGALAVGRGFLPLGVRTSAVRAAVEIASASAGLVLASVALEATVPPDRSTWLAIHLTVAGAFTTLLSLLRTDRRKVAWLGGLLLAAATWVRLADLGVDEPEPYTLPSALALLLVGLWRLRSDRSAGTFSSLGAGLLLALVPSLLWVLDDPGGPRSLLVGLACFGLVVAGAQLRWLAPLVHGAVVGLVVVLVEAGPHVGDAVPRWGLIGAAGALLIGLGVTWEQRLKEARSVAAYLRALR